MELLIYAVCLGLGVLFTGASLFVSRLVEVREAEAREEGEHARSGGVGVGGNVLSPTSPLAIALWLTLFGALGVLFESVGGAWAFYFSAPLSAVGSVLMTAVVLGWLRRRGRARP
jgi:MFS family permease